MKLSKELLKHLTAANTALIKLKSEGKIADYDIEVKDDVIFVHKKLIVEGGNVVRCCSEIDMNRLPEITSTFKLERKCNV